MAVEQVTYKNIDRGTRNMIMAGLAIAMLASCFDSTIVGTIGFEIAKDLGGMELYAWMATAYLLCETVMIPMAGKLSDVYGRKTLFLIGLAIFTGGSIIAGLSVSMEMFIVCRAIQGFGGGILIPVAMAAVQNSSRPSEMGMTTSAVNLFRSIGFTMGTAIFAMLINSRLGTELLEAVLEIYDRIPHTTDVLNGGVMSQFPMQIPGILTAFSNSVDFAFLAGGVIMLLLILVGIFFKGEMPPEEECETVGNDRK